MNKIILLIILLSLKISISFSQNDKDYSFEIIEQVPESTISGHHFNSCNIEVINENLETIVQYLYSYDKINLLVRDSKLLKKSYSFKFVTDKDKYTHTESIDVLKKILPEKLNLNIQEKEKDTIVNLIRVDNCDLLKVHEVKQNFFTTSVQHNNWKANGATLNQLKDFMIEKFHIFLEVETKDKTKYEFVIPLNDLNTAKETLKNKYGIRLDSSRKLTKFLSISMN